MTTTTIINHAVDLMDKKPMPFGRDEILGIPSFVVWNFVIVLIVALIFYWLLRSSGNHESALDILKKRYAGGEIDKETFELMKKDLEE